MSEPHHPTDLRELAGLGLAGVLLVALLLSVREALTAPFIYALLVWALWPARARSEVRSTLLVATGLVVGWFVHQFGGLLTPFLVSVGAAYVVAPLVGKLAARGLPRGAAILLVVFPILAVVTTIGIVSGPQLLDQAQALIAKLPGFAGRATTWLAGFGDSLARLPFLSAEQRTFLDRLDGPRLGAILQTYAQRWLGDLGGVGTGLLAHLGSVFGILAYVVVVPVVTFYLLLDWGKFTASLSALVPPRHLEAATAFVEEYDRALGRYVRGQLTEATLVGTLTTIGLAALGVPNALLIGVVAGVFNLIPYVGFTISILPALVTALTMDDPIGGLIRVVAVFLAVQLMDGHVTGPKIVGNSVGIHPVWIMIALTLSAAMFGFTGLLLAVPIAVLAKMLLARGIARFKASAVYNS